MPKQSNKTRIEEAFFYMQEEFENDIESIVQAQNGDKKVMQQLIETNKRLIWSIVKRFQGRGYELDDLYQVAVIGFIKCIKRFDTSFEVRLSTYAVPYILGEVKRYLRDDGPMKVSRSMKDLGMKALELQREYARKHGKEIKMEELAKELNTSKEEIALALEAFYPIHSLDETASQGDDDNDLSLLDKIGGTVDEEIHITNKLSIEQALNSLKEQEKQVILLRYYKGKTQTEIAKILGITQVQVSRIERKTLDRMKLKLAM